MEWTERRVEIPGLEVAIKMWGPAEGTPVVALHGWLDNAGSFDELIPRLEGDLQVAAVDLPGHGRSQWRGASDAYHFADWTGVVLQTADALGWESFSMIGHSMGGAVASMVAPVAPERVERMVFIDALGPMSSPADQAVEQLRRGLREERHLRDRTPRKYESRRKMIEALAEARGEVDDERLEHLAERSARDAGDGTRFFGHDPKLKASSRVRLTEEQVLAFLEGIESPVRLVRPSWGWPVEQTAMERRVAAVDDIEVVEVEGGHHVHLQHPGRVAEAIGTFLSRGSTGSE